MSTVAFWMLYEEGHIYPTFRLAHALQSSGVRVCYYTIADFGELIEAHGFEVITVLPEAHPPGWLAHMRKHAPDRIGDEIGDAYQDSMRCGTVDTYLSELAPDILLCDTILCLLVLAALQKKIKCLRISTAFSQARAPGIPPLISDLGVGDVAAADRAWETMHSEWLARPHVVEFRELEKRIIRERGYPDEWVDWDTPFSPRLTTVPEMVLCPAALDFPRPADPMRFYAESLWLDRPSRAFPWDRLDSGAPLIYCSLGSQAHRVAGARQLFCEILELARRRSDWRIVIALGDRISASEFGDIPKNAIMVPFAPQLQLLERSRLIITHGGLGTIKESIYFEVPMLVLPLMFDQPGNAARVEHHGIGMRADSGSIHAAELEYLAERIMHDGDMARRLAAMRAAFVDVEARQPGFHLVHDLLAGQTIDHE